MATLLDAMEFITFVFAFVFFIAMFGTAMDGEFHLAVLSFLGFVVSLSVSTVFSVIGDKHQKKTRGGK